MLFIAPQPPRWPYTPREGSKSARERTGTHWHSLVVTWGGPWSLQLFLEGHSFQRQPVDWTLLSRPSSPQQAQRVGADWGHSWWAHHLMKTHNPGASGVPVEPGQERVPGVRGGGQAIHPTHQKSYQKAFLRPSVMQLTQPIPQGWPDYKKDGSLQLSNPPISKILLLCFLASRRELSILQRALSGKPLLVSWVPGERCWDTKVELPRFLFQTGRGQSLPFHCSSPGRATDWTCT